MISMLLISLIQLLNEYVQWNQWPIAAKRGTEDRERMWKERVQNEAPLHILKVSRRRLANLLLLGNLMAVTPCPSAPLRGEEVETVFI